jgi:hypothetical protein
VAKTAAATEELPIVITAANPQVPQQSTGMHDAAGGCQSSKMSSDLRAIQL